MGGAYGSLQDVGWGWAGLTSPPQGRGLDGQGLRVPRGRWVGLGGAYGPYSGKIVRLCVRMWCSRTCARCSRVWRTC